MAQPPTKQAVSRPVLVQKVTLQSLQAQRIKDRVFDRTAIALYRTDVILRIIGDEAEAEQVEKIIADLLDGVQKELEGEIGRMRKLLKDNGISGLPSYTSPATYDVQISSPQVVAFLSILTGVDSLMALIDALWLNKVLDNRQRSEATYGWQRRTLRLGRRIIDIELRAYRAAQSKGKDEEVRDVAGDTGSIGDESPAGGVAPVATAETADTGTTSPAAEEAEGEVAGTRRRTAKRTPKEDNENASEETSEQAAA